MPTKTEPVTGEGAHYRLRLDLRGSEWRFELSDGEAVILAVRRPLPLTPAIPGAAVDPASVRVTADGPTPAGHRRVLLRAVLSGAVAGWVENELVFLDDRLVCASRYRAAPAHGLAAWDVAGDGDTLGADGIHAYIGRPNLLTNGQVFAPDDITLTTASHNWLYCPLCPRVLLRRGAAWVGLGGTALAHDFGLRLSAAGARLRRLQFDYGGPAAPFPAEGDRTYAGPRLQLQVTRDRSPDEAHGAFTRAMIEDGILPVRRYQPEDALWRRAWYCTFGDQMGLAKALDAAHPNTSQFLTEARILEAAQTIRRLDLPIGTIIIDEGWQDRRGDWNLNTARIPDMRRLVDRLHAMGFKVVLWWAPFTVAEDAGVRARPGLTAVNPVYGHHALDYTNPETREYIGQKLDRWFGSGPGAWDLDGVKVDFIAEQVYAHPGARDPEWRGEERLFHHLFRMLHEAVTRHKDSPGILGEAFSPFLGQYCVAFQFEERFDRQLDYIEQRPAMAAALLPGCWYAPHFTYHPDLIVPFVRRVKAVGGIPQIGKLLSPDITPEILEALRGALIEP